MSQCKKCNHTITENYCSNCGLAKTPPRISGSFILSEIASVLNFQKGFFFTIKELIIRPGKNVKQYIDIDRKHLMKPILFILLSSFFYAVSTKLFSLQLGYIEITGEDKTAVNRIINWIQNNYGYLNIITAAFISLWLKLFFKKYGYNYYETLILLCYLMGVSMLLYTLFGVIEGITELELESIAGLLSIIYFIWATTQFFDNSKFSNYLKTIFAYILGFITLILFSISLILGYEALT